MYGIGDVIVYGRIGVCEVEAIGVPDLPAIYEAKDYYTLALLFKEGRIYTPVDTHVFMRPVLSRNEAVALIDRIPSIDDAVYESRDAALLKKHYEGLLCSHDCADLIRVIKSVEVKQQCLSKEKKVLGLLEADYMRRAQEMLFDELAVALGIPRDSVEGYMKYVFEEAEGQTACFSADN